MIINKINKVTALNSLRPGAEWVLSGDELDWHDSEQDEPSAEEIANEVVRLQEEYDANKYQRDRQPEYPSMADQLDYIYHNGIAKWKSDIIKPVKDAHPKP
jgi:predicted lipoprotein